MELEETLRT